MNGITNRPGLGHLGERLIFAYPPPIMAKGEHEECPICQSTTCSMDWHYRHHYVKTLLARLNGDIL